MINELNEAQGQPTYENPSSLSSVASILLLELFLSISPIFLDI
jgi:hypothetical protein